jgi:hypothetical protein
MIGIASTRFAIALGVLAIVGLALVVRLCVGKPKRAEKWEKAEIMKQLLALSESESSPTAAAPSVRLRARPSKQSRSRARLVRR